jgi:16S rRNA (adenine1518-N6/adenine1519-N6)-dimethyltransferase
MNENQNALLRRYGIKPVKRRGQNFLIDTNLARAIAEDTVAVSPRVLELGSGAGALTIHLLERAEKVVCVEVDRILCRLLETEYGQLPQFQLMEGDLVKLDWPAAVAAAGDNPVIAGNLPYVLTSKVLFALADLRNTTSGGVFMVQKEVAERMVAGPGSRDFGVLAAVLGSLFDIQIIRHVPPSVFWPRPEVASAIVRLTPAERWEDEEYVYYTQVVKTLFLQRRKKLRTQLRTHFDLSVEEADNIATEAGADPNARPEQIEAIHLRKLARLLQGSGK